MPLKAGAVPTVEATAIVLSSEICAESMVARVTVAEEASLQAGLDEPRAKQQRRKKPRTEATIPGDTPAARALHHSPTDPLAASEDEGAQRVRSRPSRAERGRSGRHHRRNTGVSCRGFRVVEAVGVGAWGTRPFSRLCNLLKDVAPETDAVLELRWPAFFEQQSWLWRPVPQPPLHCIELALVLRGGEARFGLHEIGSDPVRGEWLYRLGREGAGCTVVGSAFVRWFIAMRL